MATNAIRGDRVFYEDFEGWDVVADSPQYATDTDPAVEIVSGEDFSGPRITMDAGQANIGGILFGQTTHDITNGFSVKARVRLSAIGTANERVGVWMTDLQEDTLSEYPFTIATTVATAVADPENAVGIFWEGDPTTKSWYALSQRTDVLTVDGVTNQTVYKPPVAATWQVVGFDVAPGGLHAEFTVNGDIIYTYDSKTIPVCADVPLILVWGCTEGTTAINADLDEIECRDGRAN